MASQLSFSFISIALLFAVASARFGHRAPGSDLVFSYAGLSGPANWGSLNPKFSTCSSGKLQDYKLGKAILVNNGFNIGLLYEGSCGVLIIDGKNYTFKQMHWHSPSEHQIDGVQYAAELHLVHLSDSGTIAVVSMLYELGDADPFISKITNRLGDLAKDASAGYEEAHIPIGALDNKLLRKNTRKYYRYVGSLTVPPCTENVIWSVLGKVRTISKEQVEALKAPLRAEFKLNARPLQSMNGRRVDLYDDKITN
ncbi:CARBONIC ANHYDRASE [Salix purpurea]|uniref:Carbonic anhydrase n=1 Tax=Salix purpurea TaxID=77065 RepID=A0A9Q0VWJ9_SALPP|nr:CARBONIC ANHYDRASE [Salix purpurea]